MTQTQGKDLMQIYKYEVKRKVSTNMILFVLVNIDKQLGRTIIWENVEGDVWIIQLIVTEK